MCKRLFPFDGSGRFLRNVVNDAVKALNFVYNSAGDSFEDFVRNFCPIGSHSVDTFDDSDSSDIFVGSFVAHHAYGFNGQEDSERLPNFFI